MEIGTTLEDFSFVGINKDGAEATFSLSDFVDQNIILYFYPKDSTPGCTQEACDFRDNFNRFVSKATVIGVSPDSITSHQKFQAKQGLNFILASDPEHEILEKFGVWGEKSMYGKKYFGVIRSTFLIDKTLTVRNAWLNVKVKGHVDEVLGTLEQLG